MMLSKAPPGARTSFLPAAARYTRFDTPVTQTLGKFTRVPANRNVRTGRFMRISPTMRGRHGLGDLGIDWAGALVGAVGGAAGAGGGTGGAGAGGTARPGGPTGQPGGSSPTTVSPTFQTDISPQISPTFQQTQSSPGSVQAATATQYKPGGQEATTGVPMEPLRSPLPSTAPFDYTKPGGLPGSSFDPPGLTSGYKVRDAGDFVRDIQSSRPFDWTPVVWIGGIGAVLVLGLTFMRKRK